MWCVWPPVQMERDALHFAKVSQFALLPQGAPERASRGKRWWRPWINLVLEIVRMNMSAPWLALKALM